MTNVGLVVADIQSVEDDFCLDVEVTSNRPDCLGVIGIAREVAAVVGANVQFPETNYTSTDIEVSKLISIAVEEPILCPHLHGPGSTTYNRKAVSGMDAKEVEVYWTSTGKQHSRHHELCDDGDRTTSPCL